ncbi:MAG: flagellar assembly protein FliW [Acidobacteria bacterium]|nr:flagellar assembly protein FliW [Acidobacteriota bacterium]
MPSCPTKHFGAVEYDESAAFQFPAGLPGFDQERRFLPLYRTGYEPLVFLQSLATRDLCFAALPVRSVDPDFELEVAEPDLELLGLDPGRLEIGRDVLCLAILTIAGDRVTANLMAPVVVNLGNLLAIQAVAPSARYSHQHPVNPLRGAAC